MHAKTLLTNLIERYKIEAIAIGNGTASRETEMFVNKIGIPKSIQVLMVNESGASIYSASEVAADGSFFIYGPPGAFFWHAYGRRAAVEVEPLKAAVEVRGDGPYRYIA
jgi:hypothetical protein